MNSTITALSVHACNFVLKILDREEPRARVWPKINDVKITTKNCHFSKLQYIYLPSCIASIPIPLFAIVTQSSKSVEKNSACWFTEFLEQTLHVPLRRCKMEFLA